MPLPPFHQISSATDDAGAHTEKNNGLVHPAAAASRGPGLGAVPVARAIREAASSAAAAHEVFLRVSNQTAALMSRQLAFQLKLIERLHDGSEAPLLIPALPRRHGEETEFRDRDERAAEPVPLAFDRRQCLEFAAGSIADVLGSEFAEIDAFPTRVRLPDEPLMLVDRIVAVEGRQRSLRPGRIVTEHLIKSEAWYLDGGRIAPSIAIEAGQADLFLCAYLGVDFETKGRAVYRLLDATVAFHRALPGPEVVIRYDIRITTFFRQGKTILFRFEFDGSIDGELLLSMRDGCAGFFSPEELAGGRGIVAGVRDEPSPAPLAAAGVHRLVPMLQCSLDVDACNALRRGDLGAAFGTPFDQLFGDDVLPLPSGLMALVHTVEILDPVGGPFGLGLIRARSEIRPGDWFMVCHFIDDRVMPGTLMYECCLHTLRIFLMRLGWIGRRGLIAYEPVPGVASRLKCRGQIVESTSGVMYEVVIKELGFRPEPYAIADAVIYADGKAIVEITDLALQVSGTDRDLLERLWSAAGSSQSRSSMAAPAARAPALCALRCSITARSSRLRSASRPRVSARLIAYLTRSGSSPGCPARRISSCTGSSRLMRNRG